MLANCKRCEKLFTKSVRDICPDCVRERTETFERIRTYLRSNRNATVPQVVEALNVTIEDVVELIEEGSLILRDFPNFSVECMRCGEPTQEGRYCNQCKIELTNTLANATSAVRSLREKQQQKRVGFYSRG